MHGVTTSMLTASSWQARRLAGEKILESCTDEDNENARNEKQEAAGTCTTSEAYSEKMPSNGSSFACFPRKQQ